MGILDKLFRGTSDEPEITIEAFDTFYDVVSVISRAIDILINSCAMVDYIIYKRNNGILERHDKSIKLQDLLYNPSSDVDNYSFYRKIFYDLVFKGNSLIYNIRTELQHIPDWEIRNGIYFAIVDNKRIKLDRENCVLIKTIGEEGKLGTPYISRINNERVLLTSIYNYLTQFFKNNSFIGIVLKTERTLSPTLKERIEKKYKDMYSMLRGNAFNPVILDGGFEIEKLSPNLKDTDITKLLQTLKSTMLESLGIPPVLVESGNNANITPNVRVFYYFTVLPLCESVASAFTMQLKPLYRISDGVIKPDLSNIPALRSDIKEESQAIRNLYSVGVITRNEARRRFGYAPLDKDIILTPMNISGRDGIDNIEEVNN